MKQKRLLLPWARNTKAGVPGKTELAGQEFPIAQPATDSFTRKRCGGHRRRRRCRRRRDLCVAKAAARSILSTGEMNCVRQSITGKRSASPQVETGTELYGRIRLRGENQTGAIRLISVAMALKGRCMSTVFIVAEFSRIMELFGQRLEMDAMWAILWQEIWQDVCGRYLLQGTSVPKKFARS